MRTTASRGADPSGTLRDLVALAAVWLAMIAIVRPRGDFPLNDDWVYAAAVKTLLATGRFEVASWSSANVGPLAYWGALWTWLFGFSYDVLRASTLVLGFAGGVLVYLLGRRVLRHRAYAWIVAATLLVDPLYFVLSCTFMTDVPFLVAVVAALAALARGFHDGDRRFVALGLAIALVAVTMRQLAVVVLVGFAAAHAGRRGLSVRSAVVATVPLALGLLVNAGFSHWLAVSGRKPFPAGIPTLVPASGANIVASLEWGSLVVVTYLGLLLLPVVAAVQPLRARRDARLFAASLVVVVLVAASLAFVMVPRGFVAPIAGNVLAWFGVGPLTNGDTLMRQINLPDPSALAHAVWIALTAASLVAAGCLAVAVGDGATRLVRRIGPRLARPQPPDDVVVLLLGATGVAYLVVLLLLSVAATLFDRYLLPLMVLVAFAAVAWGRRFGPGSTIGVARRCIVGALLVASATFSVVATHDYLAWSEARWRALERLVASGVPRDSIDGGYEFSGTYLYDARYVVPSGKNWWWVRDDEYLTASGPLPGYRVLEVVPVARWWPSAGRNVFILRR